jgi:transcriptional regulator
MYVPSAFAEERREVLHEFVRRHAFATLVTGGPDGPRASHVPVVLLGDRGERGALQFHLARANDHWHDLAAGAPALAIFQGPHGYVSPTWYANAASVPTWNYVVVHARGVPRVLAEEALKGHLVALVAAYESARPEGWDPSRLPVELFDRLRAAVVGFEIPIERLEGKWKLGQNRTRDDREGAIDGLRGTGDGADRALADWMAAALGGGGAG